MGYNSLDKLKKQSVNEDELDKRRIMKELGIKDNDVNEYFDVMDDRVYDQK